MEAGERQEPGSDLEALANERIEGAYELMRHVDFERIARQLDSFHAVASKFALLDTLAIKTHGLEKLTDSHLYALTQTIPSLPSDAVLRSLWPSPAILEATRAATLVTTNYDALLEVALKQEQAATALADFTRRIPLSFAVETASVAAIAGKAFSTIGNAAVMAGVGSLAAYRAEMIASSFHGFTQATTGRVPMIGATEAESALAVGELTVGSDILGEGTTSFGGLVELGSGRAIDDGIVLNVFAAINEEIDSYDRSQWVSLRAPQVTEEIAQLLSVRIARETKRVIDSRNRCNRSSQLINGEPVFKATTETEDAIVVLMFLVADNESQFREVVHRLYTMLYESSGEYKRLPEEFRAGHEHGLFDLKHLRTHFFHDVDHGRDADVRHKFRRPGEIFERLCGVPVPRDRTTWRRAQSRLLASIGRMLEELDDAINAGKH